MRDRRSRISQRNQACAGCVDLSALLHPGYEMVLTVTPDKTGDYGIVCNEFCGIGHHMMTGKMYVVE